MNTTLYQAKESAESLLLLLQKSTGFDQGGGLITSGFPLSLIDVSGSSKIHKVTDSSAERIEDYSLSGFGDKFLWECPENLRDRMSQTAITEKRKMSSLDGVNRRRGDHSPADTMAQSAFLRGSVPTTSSGPTCRDSFQQRKPNTSRPPSMHVDDYVARERNVDGTTSSNVIAVARLGPISGRPPSIHVDEFMARQRERQNPVGMVVSEATTQVNHAPPENEADAEVGKSKQLKQDLDDDLQGIDIVFDGEESDSDEKLPFPQPEDNLHQPASVIVEQSSPHSIVAETESDDNTQSELSSRMSVSRPDMSLTREPSISSDKTYSVQSEDAKNVTVTNSIGFDSAAKASSSRFSSLMYNKTSGPSVQPDDSTMPQPNFYPKKNLQQVGIGSQGFYDQKFHLNQPPLPPMPPPPTVSPVLSQSADPVQTQLSPFASSMIDVQPPPSPRVPCPDGLLGCVN